MNQRLNLIFFVICSFVFVGCGGASSGSNSLLAVEQDVSDVNSDDDPAPIEPVENEPPEPTPSEPPPPAPVTPAPEEPVVDNEGPVEVEGICLVGVEDYDLCIGSNISNGDDFDKSELPSIFNFVFTFSNDPGSADVDLICGDTTVLDRFENRAIYTAAEQSGGNGGDITPSELPAGECTMTITPYEFENVSGEAGDSYVRRFTISEGEDPEEQMDPPVLPSDVSTNISENTLNVGNFRTIAGAGPITYSISGLDSASFTIAPSGLISFTSPPDFENPSDSDGDNRYEATLTASNSFGSDTLELAVSVVDIVEGVAGGGVVASIKASRSSCSSPCTVVFSAEETLDDAKSSSDVWRDLLYYWDFDTDSGDTYGSLYNQTYDYWGLAGQSIDSATSVGHKPMATKTFLCDSGTCTYRVGLRAQNEMGQFDDAFTTITVNAERSQWDVSNTVCVSNTLNTNSDWTGFDKGCPAGATKQSSLPSWDQYQNKLILLKKGDVFNQNIAPRQGQSNWKLGYFGDDAESKPNLAGQIFIGTRAISGGTPSAPQGYPSFNYDADVNQFGWPRNITIDGIAVDSISLPASYEHIGMHDLTMDGQGKNGFVGAVVAVRGSTYCHDFPTDPNRGLTCSNVPYPKGFYLSSTYMRGADDYGNTLNVFGIGCSMINYVGIVDTFMARALEHNIRVMGWYRYNIHASHIAGGHSFTSKQKVSNRPCATGPNWSSWNSWKSETWDDDIEGRTRADGARNNGTNGFNTGDNVKRSRWQAVTDTVMGDTVLRGNTPGGPIYQSNVASPHELLVRDVIVSDSTFIYAPGESSSNINFPGDHMTCKNNTYANGRVSCFPDSDTFNNVIERDILNKAAVQPPGS